MDIKDIFVWHRDLPRMPLNLTTVQQEDWNQRRAALLASTSFAGERVTSCYARIFDVTNDKITAYADYALDYLIFRYERTPFHGYYEPNVSKTKYTQIQYDISYDQRQFHDAIIGLHTGQMISFTGQVRQVQSQAGAGNESSINLSLQLSLLSIAAIETTFLHATLLDDGLKYQPKSRCFIATAAFESPAKEIDILRNFRDAVLARHRVGTGFVSCYEAISPPVASVIRRSPLLRRLTRLLLVRLVVPLVQRVSLDGESHNC